MRSASILCSGALMLAAPALAVDGVVEINQAAALNGGVTSGDTAGFPVTLSESGSYRLTSALVVDENTTAISITGDRVHLDLNGFAIEGPTTCSLTTPLPPAVSCSTTGTGDGIVGGVVSGTEIRNGRIVGMGRHGIDLNVVNASGARIHDVSISDVGGDCLRGPTATRADDVFVGACGGAGMDLGLSSRVDTARIQAVGDWAITAVGPLEVNDALISSAVAGGIGTTSGGAQVMNSTVSGTGNRGIDVGDGSVIRNVTANSNSDTGILCGALCTVENVRAAGNESAVGAGLGSRISNVHAQANTSGGVSSGNDSLVTDCRLVSNGGVIELGLGDGSAYGGNLIDGSTTVSGTNLVEISTNVCNGSTTCP